MGIRPTVRGSVMNPNDHPHGGGEGKSPVGHPGPMTPWGKPAMGLNIAGGNAGQVGSDLVVAAVAALRDYPAPVIIIDMGTATTMMAIDQTGTFLGGSICPGVKVSSEVLTTRTSQLPGISLEAPKHVIGRNTIECMQSGIMLGAACMIDGMIERMEEELGVKATVVATGGISRFVLPMCRSEIRYDRDLLLRGLRILYEKNKR